MAAAQEAGLPYGKYRAFLELQALDPTLTPEDVAGMTMKEIRAWIDELAAEDAEARPAAKVKETARARAVVKAREMVKAKEMARVREMAKDRATARVKEMARVKETAKVKATARVKETDRARGRENRDTTAKGPGWNTIPGLF